MRQQPIRGRHDRHHRRQATRHDQRKGQTALPLLKGQGLVGGKGYLRKGGPHAEQEARGKGAAEGAPRKNDPDGGGHRRYAADDKKPLKAAAYKYITEQKAKNKRGKIKGGDKQTRLRRRKSHVGVINRQQIRDVGIAEHQEKARSEKNYLFIFTPRSPAAENHTHSPRSLPDILSFILH